jgi:hypothetical protein
LHLLPLLLLVVALFGLGGGASTQTMTVPNEMAGAIIGKGGQVIRGIQE